MRSPISTDLDPYTACRSHSPTDVMNALRSVYFFLLLPLSGLLISCEERPPLLTEQEQTTLDTSYVLLSPSFSGFTSPQDVMIGNDQLLYVADTKANRLVMLNRAGQLLSSRTMIEPISLAQDSRLDLLVGGAIIAANGDTVGAIFRIHLVDASHHLDQAVIDTVWRELAKPQRRFPGITVFGDNAYLAVRTGPDNSSFVDPDARVLDFAADDTFVSPVPAFNSTSGGSITNINRPTSIASFPGVKDFVLAQAMEGVAYGAVWMQFEETVNFVGWLLRFDPASLDDRGIDFIKAGRFERPEGVTIDERRRDVFIADAGLDSVFKFNSRGRFKSESFGFVRSGGAMREPTGLAFFETTLYVCDAEIGEVLRFRLSTDIPR